MRVRVGRVGGERKKASKRISPFLFVYLFVLFFGWLVGWLFIGFFWGAEGENDCVFCACMTLIGFLASFVFHLLVGRAAASSRS